MVDSSIVVTAPRRQPRVGMAVSRLRDETLARRVRDGDERAFAEIHRRYHGPLYRYCRSIVRHEHDAQDVLQTTLIAAYGALRAGRRDAPLRPWLYRIAHNESISLLRRRRPEAELAPTLPDLVGVEERADVRERMSRLVADLMALPERQRSALIMRELNGLSHEDIALALQTTPAAAKQTVFEARRALSELEAGRAMSCDDVCRVISDGDGRQLRGRRVRSHLRACHACGAFAEAISTRRSDLRALAPGLPVGVGTGLLWHVLGGPPARSTTGAASVKALGAGALSKTLATGLLIAGGVAGYTHLAHGTGRALGHVGARAPLTRALDRGSSPRPAPGRSIRSGGRDVGAGPDLGRRAGVRRHAAPIRAGDQSGRRPGAAAAALTTVGRSSTGPRPSQASPTAGSAATRAPAAPAARGRGVDAHGGAPAVGAPARGASAVHAVRRGRAGADQPPGQGQRRAGSTVRGRGAGGASSRGSVSDANSGQSTGSASGVGAGPGRSSAPGEGVARGSAATSTTSTAGVASPGSSSGSGIASGQSRK
jgi:RNA polymerase sigma factor (sigma-70 family)